MASTLLTRTRPKSVALTMLVDWSNQDSTETAAAKNAGVQSTCHPCWLCIHFGPPPNAGGPDMGQWQWTMNIYAAEKTPLVKKQNEEPIPKDRRAVLWHNLQPFEKYRYGVVQQHCKFPPNLTPRVVAFHADRAEPDANALVWVRKTTSLKRHREDSYLKVVRGHIYHFHFTFNDGSLVTQYIAQGWGFTASLFTYKRKSGHITVSPSRAVTQIRANWLEAVEAEPDAEELEQSRLERLHEQRDEKAAAEKMRKSGVPRGPAIKRGYSSAVNNSAPVAHPYNNAAAAAAKAAAAAAAAAYGGADGSVSSSSSTNPAPSAAAAAAAAAAASNPAYANNGASGSNATISSTTDESLIKKRALNDWTINEINALAFTPDSNGNEMPDQNDLRSYDPLGVDLNSEISSLVEMPPPAPATSSNGTILPLTEAMKKVAQGAAANVPFTSLSPAEKELLVLFRDLEHRAKVVASDTSNPLREAAVRLTKVLSASGQLPGWRHVEEYMTDPEAYNRNRGPAAVAAALTHGGPPRHRVPGGPKGKIEILSDTSGNLLRAALTRARWVMDVERKSGQQDDGKRLERILGVLLKDTNWMRDTEKFLKDSETAVSSLISGDPARFAKFRDVQSRGVQWPHSPHLRRHIERAGFRFRPMMIKRDRCVCDSCGVEVSGWRPWHNPWLLHDWTKRHPFAPPPNTPPLGMPPRVPSITTPTPTPGPTATATPTPGPTAAAASAMDMSQT